LVVNSNGLDSPSGAAAPVTSKMDVELRSYVGRESVSLRI
jgi:hypothetical protein